MNIQPIQPDDLPESSQDLKRAGKAPYNLINDVERIFLSLYDDAQKGEYLRKLLRGVENGKFSFSGKTEWDDFLATQLIQKQAREENENSFIAVATPVAVYHAYRTVISRRYPQLNRKLRREALYAGTNGQ